MTKSSLLDTFISTRMMAALLLIFAISIGAATFIEDKWDTEGAQRVVYHAWWFKTVLILLCINFIGNIKRYQLLQRKKWSILLIHIGLIITIIGAGITHYFGFEGIIRVKEGEVASHMWTADAYFEVQVINEESGQMYKHPMKLKPSTCPLLSNHFEFEIDPFQQGATKFEYMEFMQNVTLGAPVDSSENGINTLELVFEGMKSEYIPEGTYLEKDGYIITYNNPQSGAINITGEDEFLQIEVPEDVNRLSMETQTVDTLFAGKHKFEKRHLHSLPALNIVLKDFHYKLDRPIVSADNGQDVLKVKVTHNGEDQIVTLWGGKDIPVDPESYVIGGETFYLRFGKIEMDLPFSIKLDKFILGTYEGSDRHSSYRSEVSIYPDGVNPMEHEEKYSIYMNNVLDYEGYRLFQSGYDQVDGVDRTTLQVNNDFWGTTVTYLGYLILSIGFIFSLFNSNSRFVKLGKSLTKKSAKATIVAGLMLTAMGASAQKYTPLSQEHCDKFNELLVVSYTGRIQPCNSLAYDLIRKLARKDYMKVEGTDIKLSPEQFMLDLFVEPGFWADQKVMKFKAQTGLGKDLNIKGNYMAFTDVLEITTEGDKQFIQPKVFKIEHNGKVVTATFDSLVSWAESKPLGERNVYDKEVLKLNEKVVLFWQATQGHLFKIIPVKVEGKEKPVWASWFDEEANIDFSQGNFEGGKELTGVMLVRTYLNALIDGKSTGDYTSADKVLEIIKVYQRKVYESNPEALPSEELVRFEIMYNQWNVFKHLKYLNVLLALLLLPLTLIERLSNSPKKWLKLAINVCVGLLALGFLAHTLNLGLRTYIIGHAPWSDGYEALTLIAWGVVLAGLIFFRYSAIVTGAAGLMAFLILMTAGHSQYDPQMSDLEPVLKSYWLNIHVAAITLSYAFFGLGFILSLINLGIMSSRGPGRIKKTTEVINELSNIIEMTLTIGLVLATIGTFLGGVWANESWGRYWGWDAKETWALVIVLVYAFVIHMRFIPGLRGKFTLNLLTLWSFSTVIMTFVGVNYYLTKGLHSYARGDAPAFAWWAWVMIFGLIVLSVIAWIKEKKITNQTK